MWELAGSAARVLKNHAANIIFLCGSWLALGRTLKNDAANIILSRESAGCSSKTKILEAAQRASISNARERAPDPPPPPSCAWANDNCGRGPERRTERG